MLALDDWDQEQSTDFVTQGALVRFGTGCKVGKMIDTGSGVGMVLDSGFEVVHELDTG